MDPFNQKLQENKTNKKEMETYLKQQYVEENFKILNKEL